VELHAQARRALTPHPDALLIPFRLLTNIASFADGDRVVLVYYPHTATTTTAPAAECFTVRGERIVESVLVFDRLSFAPAQRTVIEG